MVRTSVMLDDELAARVRFEARRRRVSMAEVVREALETHVPSREPGPLAFFGIGEGIDIDPERFDDLVAEAIAERHDRDR